MNFLLIIAMGCLFLAGNVFSEVSTQCEGQADILFIIDASGSIGKDNFEKVRQFLANLTSNFRVGSDAVRFSELVFSSTNHDVFNFTAHLFNAALKEAIRATIYYSGSTNTGGALKQARTFSFTSANGARPDVPKIAVVLTDGLSDNRTDTTKEAALLKQSGVTVMAIGVGSGVAESELLAIATSPQHVYNVTGFNSLDTIRHSVAFSACEESVKQCEGRADVLLVIDASGSLGVNNLETVRQFVASLSYYFKVDRDAVHFSELVYSISSRDEFGFNAYLTNAAVAQAFKTTSYYGSWGDTYTGAALRHARMLSFSTANGARPDVAKIALVLTQGKAHDGMDTVREAALLKQSGVTVLVIGVGPAVDRTELSSIATSPKHVFNVANFSALSTVRSNVTQSACEILGQPITPGCIQTSCYGLQDGDHPSCGEECQEGYYYTCARQNATKRECPLGWYVDTNNNSCTARMVYDPATKTCQLKSDTCARNVSRYCSVPVPQALSVVTSRFRYTQCISSCLGRPNGEYAACLPECQDGIYYICAAGNTSIMLCDMDYYDNKDGGRDYQRKVYDPATGTCNLTSTYCPRDSGVGQATSPSIASSTVATTTPSAATSIVTSRFRYTPCISSCLGRPNGEYAACLPECQDGIYYSCAAGNTSIMLCDMDYYENKDGSRDYQRKVYDPATGTCNLTSTYCPRNSSVGQGNSPSIAEPTVATTTSASTATNIVTSRFRYTQCISSCLGRPNGEYAACLPDCQDGVYYSCAAGNTSIMLCDMDYYENKDGSRDYQRKVYDPATGTCNLTSTYCPRNSSVGQATSPSIAAPTVATTTASAATSKMESPQCKRKSDILLIVDASGSIGDANFETMRQFTADLTSKFVLGQDFVRFSQLVFSTSLHNEFDFNAYATSSTLYEALLRTPYYSGMTFMGPALKQARTLSFSSVNGARPDAAKIAVILTDGQFNDINCTRKEAALLKQSGVTVISIGVGPDVEVKELLATATTSLHMFNVCDFESLKNITATVARTACEENNFFKCVLKTCEGFPDGDYPSCETERDGALYYTCYNDKKLNKLCTENRVFNSDTKKCEAKY